MTRHIAWVDGVNSAVMAYMALSEIPDLVLAHCDLGDSVHADSRRFIDDLEKLYEHPILRIRSDKFADIDEVFEKTKYLSGPKGAPCTREMKFVPRMNYELPSDVHLWGYTADGNDTKRFRNMQTNYPFLHQRSPLIDWRVTKKQCHLILEMLGVRRPWVYDIGMPNGNCPGCVKASSPNYWALIRKYFPIVFARRNEQARRFGCRLVIIGTEKGPNGKRRNIRCYPDEIPLDQPTTIKGSFGGCGFHCATA